MWVLGVLATFQVLSNHIWLVATIMNSADIGHFYHYRKFYWRILLQSMPKPKGIFLKYNNFHVSLTACSVKSPFNKLRVKSGFLACVVYSLSVPLQFWQMIFVVYTGHTQTLNNLQQISILDVKNTVIRTLHFTPYSA